MSQRQMNLLAAVVVVLVLGALCVDAVRAVRDWSRRGNYKRGYIAG